MPETPLTNLPGQEAGPPEATKRRVSLWRVGGSLLSLALLAYLVYQQGWGEFSGAVRQIPLGYFFLALGLALCSRACVVLRWYTLLRWARAPISLWQTVKLVFMGLFSSNFLPSTVGGDLVRLAGAVYLRLDAGVSAASLLVDRLVGMAGMALMLPAGLATVLGAGGTAASGGLLALPKLRPLWQRFVRFLRSLLQSSIFWVRHPASLGVALLFTFGHMLFTYLIVEVFLSGMGHPLSLWKTGGLWSFSYFVSLAPFSINGLGLQEVSIAYLYSHFGGVPLETGLALAVLLRLVFMLVSLPGAVFLPMMGGVKAKPVAPGPEPR